MKAKMAKYSSHCNSSAITTDRAAHHATTCN